ncbi:MAG: restriction endonuclease subunit S [Paludibacteraceae bacterium]|nr:restriction endonuclease subunit S [Paludibacteraceae bacterium]
MNNSTTTYKRLGDYIREVDVRNSDLSVSKLVGLTIAKAFIPSVANTIGTDLSKYKIIKENQFACSLMQVSRDGKMPIAIYKGENAIMSPAYPVFEVYKEGLLPDYLQMWFSRPEFDREAVFYAVGGVRGSLDWNDFMDMMLPVPSLDEQQRIVDRYNAIKNRIETNKQTIAKLEEAAQALYRKMFVDNIDPENLPEGWRMGTIKDFCKEMKSGGTPSRTNPSYWNAKDFAWLKSGEVHNNVILETEDYISEAGLNNSSAKIIPEDSVVMAMYGATAAEVAYLKCATTTNQACCNMICHSKEDAAYLYFHLRYYQEEIKKLANGGAQENLSQELIANQPIILGFVPHKFATIIEQISLLTKEHKLLTQMLSLLMVEMG